MKKGLLLLLGIILIVILSYFCFMGKAQGINEDLVSKSQAAYQDKQIGWVDVALKGKELEMTRTLVLSGVAPSIQKREEAEVMARAIKGVLDVDNQLMVKAPILLAPIVKTPVTPAVPVAYKMAVTKDKLKKVTLLGDVPNIDVHNQLVSKAKTLFGDENVIDKLTELKGKPIAWKESITLGLERLADVDYGHFNMDNKAFDFEGHVEDKAKESAILTNLKANLNTHYVGTYKIIAPEEVKVVEVVKPVAPSPYTVSVIKGQSNQITLSGYVPNSEVHKELVDQANNLVGVDNVVDMLKEIEGSPQEWKESATHGIAKLANVEYGRFNMSDTNFNFEGYVGTEEEKAVLLTQLADKLSSSYDGTYKIAVPKITIPSPYTIMGIKDKNNTKQITLTGYVANADMHKEIVSHATGLFGEGNVIDELKEIKGSPEAWRESSILSLDKLKLVDYGQFNISDTNYNFIGYIGSEDAKSEMIRNLNTHLSSVYSSIYDITAPVVKSFSCQEHFEALLAKEKIHFEYDRAAIKQSSYDVLDKLVDIANQCPNAQIEVEGHTDSDGSKTYNQKLSSKRANAVRTYLIGKDIQSNRLKAIGYGEIKPIATNKTSKGKEQNRRIEFNVKGMK